MINKKTKAFTLAEMLVVLVVSAIVVSMAVVVLNLVRREMASMESIQQKTAIVERLEQILWHDFNQGAVIYNAKNSSLLVNRPNDSVLYQFFEDYVIRNYDTLKTGPIKPDFFLDGRETFGGHIDALELNFEINKFNKPLFVYRHKDAAHYMNNGI